MERMVTTRLTWYLEKNLKLSNTQCGFRKNRSTVDHILRLTDTINKYNHNKGFTLAVFLDFEKAYDMIWRKGLFIKLHNIGIRDNMLNFISNFLENRTMQVRISDCLSTKRVIENGTAQGSVISPILFLLMINDLPNELEEVESALFADDCAIFKAGKNINFLTKKVQMAIDHAADWCKKWGFKLSAEKN
jgi:retron-type reverse transcriptase